MSLTEILLAAVVAITGAILACVAAFLIYKKSLISRLFCISNAGHNHILRCYVRLGKVWRI